MAFIEGLNAYRGAEKADKEYVYGDVVIVRLFTSTIRSLLVVPAVFELVDDLKQSVHRFFRSFGARLAVSGSSEIR